MVMASVPGVVGSPSKGPARRDKTKPYCVAQTVLVCQSAIEHEQLVRL
jgi:hypothetical protein